MGSSGGRGARPDALEAITGDGTGRVTLPYRLRLGAFRHTDILRRLSVDDYLYFGQLAETYLSQARGHCAGYAIHEILYKPKIPWWEWVQEIVDVWDPIQQARGPEGERRAQWLGAVGAGPRPELAATITLGAALVTAATHRPAFAQEGARTADALDAAFTHVLAHAVGEFRSVLTAGGELERRFEKVAAAPLEAR
jgi:hypothetical protein